MLVAQVVLSAAGLYILAGMLFAVWFVAGGVGRLDDAARHGSLAFRALIFPGVVALWPLLAWIVWHAGPGEKS